MTGLRPITAVQARNARKLLGWTQRHVAERISFSVTIICQAERGNLTSSILARLRSVYETAGVEFTNGGQPGVRMRKEHP